MIFTKDGTPLGEALMAAGLTLAQYRTRQQMGRVPNYLYDADGKRAYTIRADKNGDAYAVFRLKSA